VATNAASNSGRFRPPLAKRLTERGVDRTLLLLLPGLLFSVGLFIYPMLYGLQLSLSPEEGGTFANYRRFFSDSFFRDTMWLTTRLAVPAVLINVALALPLAYRMRYLARGRRVVTLILIFPLTLGSVLLAKGLLNFLSGTGWLNRLLLELGIIDVPLQLIHNYWGVLIALVVADFPFVFLLLLSYAAGIDPAYERAAAVFGASPWQRFRRITFPLLAPGLAITSALAFVLAFGVFPSAILLGAPEGETRTMAVAAFREGFQQFDFAMGTTIALLMAVIELAVIIFVLALRAWVAPTRGTGRKG
jgi:putative spermidine/putrescine transport system permease protein